jgi:hypothetical protein
VALRPWLAYGLGEKKVSVSDHITSKTEVA